MSANVRKFGKPVRLLVDAKGFPDGRLVVFEIWKQSGSSKDKIAEVNGVVKREKGIGEWEPPFKREPSLPHEQKISQQSKKDQYSFTAKIDDKTTQGGPIEFTYFVELFIVDTNGNPLNEVKITITFSDGTKKQDVLKNGRVRFDDVPQGKFTTELEGYDFVFS
jgi:hypothetical protein